jgi:TM2 domain-containing membrane protein YozV
MALPVVRNLKLPPQQQNHRPQPQGAKGYQSTALHEGKSKSVATMLAFTLGLWGVHRFYLGKRFLGIANFAAFFFGMAMVIEERMPWILVMLALIAVIEGVLFSVMPQGEFDAKYNNGLPSSRKERKAMQKEEKKRQPEAAQTRKSRGNFIIKDAFIAYRSGNYDQARKYFEDALQYDYNDPQTHFMLSCCHSMAKDSKQAYFHLASSVDFGFQEFEEIYHNEALTWLRAQPDFDTFVKNGYRQVAYLSTPKPDLLETKNDLLETKSYYDTTMLDKIADLGELLERGVISKDDFESQKKSILGY